MTKVELENMLDYIKSISKTKGVKDSKRNLFCDILRKISWMTDLNSDDLKEFSRIANFGFGDNWYTAICLLFQAGENGYFDIKVKTKNIEIMLLN